jgi:hypothetical protein
MTPWNQGREQVQALIDSGHVEKEMFNDGYASELLQQSRRHLDSAAQTANSDAIGAYVLVYDAARKALAAFLAIQNLRATTRGGHIALYDVAKAQLDPPKGKTLTSFDRMRHQRNTMEYRSYEMPDLTVEDVMTDHSKASELVEMVELLLDKMPVF